MGPPLSTRGHAMKPLGVLCIVLIWAGVCQAQPGQPFPPRGQGGFGGGGGNNFGGGGGGNFNRGAGGGFGGGPGGGFQQPAAVTTPSRAFVTPTQPQPQQQQPVFQQQQLPTQVGRGAGNSGNVFGGGGPGARGQDDRPQFQPRQQPQPIVTQPQPQPTITQPQPQPRAEPQPQPQPKAQPEPQPLPKAQPQPQPQPEAKAQPAQQQQPSLAGNVRAVDGGRDGNNRNDRNDRNQQSGQQGTGGDNKQANQQPAAGQPQQPQGQQQTRAVDGQGDNRQGDNKQGDNKQGDNRQGDNKQRERPDLNRVTGGTDQFKNKPQRDIDLQPEGETLRRNIQDNPRAAAESLATAYTSGRGDAAAKALTAAAASGAGATAAARAFAETSRVRPNAAPWLLRQSADYAVNYGLVGGWSRAFAQSFGWARQNNFLPSFVPAICNAILGGGFGTRYAFGSAFASAFAYDRPAFVEASAVAFCSGGSYAQAWAEASAVAIQQDPYTGCPVIREAYSTAYARCGPGFAQSWANTQSVSTVIGFCAAQVGGFWPGPFGK